jgi:Regulator of ribonuclease activity B
MSDSEFRAAAEDLVNSLTEQGWDFSLPRFVSHDAVARTHEGAEALATVLREAGYVVEFVDDDPDHNRWMVTVREAEMMLVTADALCAARVRIEPIILASGGQAFGFGVDTREEER